MKKTIPLLAILMAELCLAAPLVAATARTATENFVTNKIAAAISQIPPPDYSTNNAALVATIEATAPAPGDYANVSNKAVNAVQTEVDPTVPAWAKAASKPTYTASEVGAIPTTGGVFNASLHLNQKLSVGTWTSSVKPYDISGGSGIAFVFGDNVQTKQSNTMTLGVGALNTNAWSFIWNGDAYRMYVPGFPAMSNPYATRHNGGFHVNPSVRSGMVNPLQNFWIGDTNLNDWIVTLSPPATWATLSGKPTNVSAFSNDAGYLTGYTETDPTISAWAKAANKPTYTASEVGATTPEDVTAAIREQSLGGIWDEELQVWWTPRMRNGSLTYEATTNVNLNAEN